MIRGVLLTRSSGCSVLCTKNTGNNRLGEERSRAEQSSAGMIGFALSKSGDDGGDFARTNKGRKEEEKRISCVVTLGSWFLFACVFGYLTELLTRIDGDGSRISTRRPFLVCGGGHCKSYPSGRVPSFFFLSFSTSVERLSSDFRFLLLGVWWEKKQRRKRKRRTPLLLGD